jgi:hypothetical protein
MGTAAKIAVSQQMHKSESCGDYKVPLKVYLWIIFAYLAGALFMWGILLLSIWMERFY